MRSLGEETRHRVVEVEGGAVSRGGKVLMTSLAILQYMTFQLFLVNADSGASKQIVGEY